MKHSQADRDRLIHINFTMDEIHDSADAIYEGLIDREYSEVRGQVTHLMSILETIRDSIDNGR
jgi:hypothetical protein|tara:strand:- start:275 stop:463 length:189 start_codon:yes stop_codon:yes gene_type:complete